MKNRPHHGARATGPDSGRVPRLSVLRVRHARTRRLYALLCAVLWVLGFDIGPGLHLAAHELLDHHHHGSSSHVDVHEGEAPEDGAHGHDEHGHDEHGHGHGHGHDGEPEHGHDENGHEAREHPADATPPDFAPVLSLALDQAPVAEAVARCADDLSHGAHALAHRGVAASPTSPPWPAIAVAPWVPLNRAERSVDPIRSRTPRCVRARGPPV